MYVYIFDLNFQGINHVAWVSFFAMDKMCLGVVSWIFVGFGNNNKNLSPLIVLCPSDQHLGFEPFQNTQ